MILGVGRRHGLLLQSPPLCAGPCYHPACGFAPHTQPCWQLCQCSWQLLEGPCPDMRPWLCWQFMWRLCAALRHCPGAEHHSQ